MRTFQELHAKALEAAVDANARGNLDAAEVWRNQAAKYDRIDKNAVARKAARGNGPGAHHG